MADSDEENVAALGTPFEELEEDAPRKKPVPIHDQVVTDSRGRRRFHGAFTGGFSAGYFNTVDTKEGWEPKTFISSRSQKSTESAAQRPEDYMDEDDFGEFGIAPKRVVTTEKFLPTDKEGSQRKRVLGPARPSESERSIAGVIQGNEILRDLIVPVKMSVGVKLLTQMGWKQGQGIGPRVRRVAKNAHGCASQPSGHNDDDDDIYAVGLLFAPKDIQSTEYKSKDNLHGIGYSGINPKTALLNQRDWLGQDPGTSTVGIRGQGFGVGALEEDDDDIYKQDILSNYDIELGVETSRKKSNLHGWTGPPQTSEKGGLLSVFTRVSKPPSRKVYPPPVVPRDFTPLHKASAEAHKPTPQTRHSSSSKSVKLTAKERGEALGETPLPTPRKSVFDYIAEEDKTRLKEPKDTRKTKQQSRWSVSGTGTSIGNSHGDGSGRRDESNNTNVPGASKRIAFESSGFKPFAKEPEKQARYELFLSGKSAEAVPSGKDCSKMTEWERECEAEEFARSAELYRPLSQTMAARFTSEKESEDQPNNQQSEQKNATPKRVFGAMTRQRLEWHPDRVLCKRFNIPDPYPGSAVTGVPSSQKRTTFEERLDEQMKAIDYQATSEVQKEEKCEDRVKTSALLAGFEAISSRTPVTIQESSSLTDSSTNQGQTGEKNMAESDVLKLASMDLFKTVFADSSSESNSEESDDEEEDEVNQEDNKKEEIENKEKQTPINSTCVENPKFSFETRDDDIVQPTNETGSGDVAILQRNISESNAAKDTFGPVSPSVNVTKPSSNSQDFEQYGRRDKKAKHKVKKKKKEKSRKYKDYDSDDDSDYDKHKKSTKRDKKPLSDNSEDGHRERNRSKDKKKSRYSDSEESDSDEDYKKHDRNKKKKGKKPKERKKHKTKKDKNEKHRNKADFNLEDYEEKTIENVTKYSQNERPAFQHEKLSGKSSIITTKEIKEREENDDNDAQSINNDIMSKLKNIQLLKQGKRMRAADFM